MASKRKRQPSQEVGNDVAKQASIALAIGCIFRLAAGPFQSGDIAEYDRCRSVILDQVESVPVDRAPNYVRDRLCGAQGD